MTGRPVNTSHKVDGKYSIGDLVDLERLQVIFQKFYDATGFTIGFLDHPDLNILIAVGWRDICTKFHRSCPASADICLKSNRRLLDRLNEPGQVIIERCENGLVDCATPIIIKGIHVASLATGQLLVEKPDVEWFRKQARLYGFDEEDYIGALKEIPVFTEEQVRNATGFLGEIAMTISDMGYDHLIIKEKSEQMEEEISRRKRADTAMRESEQKLRAILDQSFELIGLLTTDGRVVDANVSALNIAGVDHAAVLGKPFWDTPWWTHSPELQNQLRDAVRRAANGEFIRFEATHKDADGNIHGIDFSLKPVKDNNGTVVFLIPEGRDITDLNKAKATLVKSEKKFHTIADFTYDWEYWQGPDGSMIYVSPSCERITGYPPQEFYTNPHLIEEIIHPGDRVLVDHLLTPQGNHQTTTTADFRIRHRDGTIRWMGHICHQIVGPDGISLGNRVSNRDITDRKRAEDDLRRLYDEQEIRIEERTADLRQMKEAYQQANEKLNLLNSITRHDILNQPTVLEGYLELTDRKVQDEGLRPFIHNAEKAAGIIEQLIQFTKIYQDVGVTAPAWQNVSEIVEKTRANLLPASVSCDADLDELEIFADPLFEKVVFTLMENTLRHGERFTGIRMMTRIADDVLTLVYMDNGVGINNEEKERIFERGFGKNTGYGLYLARTILAITGLTIRETGEPGKGARFEIAVPKGAWRVAPKKPDN